MWRFMFRMAKKLGILKRKKKRKKPEWKPPAPDTGYKVVER